MGNGLEKCARITSLKGCCGELVFGTIPLSVSIANIAATGTCVGTPAPPSFADTPPL
jgi:hypothetical protein